MEILKGKVQDPGFPDTEVTYIKTDDGKTYFFIENGNLKNGNFIATPILKEGIGHAPYTSLGLITPNGEILIPFENKNIKVLSNDLLLVERNVPVTESVVEALKKQNDPLSAAELIESANTIKQQIKSVMGLNGDFIFDNQFSEAALYTTAGVNLANNYFSFIGAKDGAYFMGTSVVGSPISKYDPYAYAMQDEESAGSSEQTGDQVPSVNSTEQQGEDVQTGEQTQETTDSVIPWQQENDSLNMPLFPQKELEINQTQVNSNEGINVAEESDQPQNAVESSAIPNINVSDAEEIDDSSEEKFSDDSNAYEENPTEQAESSEINIPNELNISLPVEDNDSSEGSSDLENDSNDIESSIPQQEISDETEEESDEEESDDGGNSNSDYDEQENIDETLNNPVIVNATNTIKKLLEENRKQRQLLDQRESEIETLTSSNNILKEDNDSKTKEIISIRNSMNKYRKDNTELLRENKHLTSINSRHEEIINNLKMQNTTLKEQVAGITALNSAVAEANNLFTVNENKDDSLKDYSYLDEDEEDSYQYTKTAE